MFQVNPLLGFGALRLKPEQNSSWNNLVKANLAMGSLCVAISVVCPVKY